MSEHLERKRRDDIQDLQDVDVEIGGETLPNNFLSTLAQDKKAGPFFYAGF